MQERNHAGVGVELPIDRGYLAAERHPRQRRGVVGRGGEQRGIAGARFRYRIHRAGKRRNHKAAVDRGLIIIGGQAPQGAEFGLEASGNKHIGGAVRAVGDLPCKTGSHQHGQGHGGIDRRACSGGGICNEDRIVHNGGRRRPCPAEGTVELNSTRTCVGRHFLKLLDQGLVGDRNRDFENPGGICDAAFGLERGGGRLRLYVLVDFIDQRIRQRAK